MIHMMIEVDISTNSCWAYHRYICIQIETFIDVCVYILGFPCGSADKESSCDAGDLGSIPGLGRCPGEGKGYPLQYSGLENSVDNPWGHKELNITERLKTMYIFYIIYIYIFFFLSYTLLY